MDETEHTSPGMMDSFRQLRDSAGALLEARYGLVKVELQEEKFRLIQVFIWISAAIVSGMLATMFASLSLLYFFKESAPVAVLVSLAVFYSAALVFIIFRFKKIAAKQPRILEAMLEDVKKGDPSETKASEV